MAEMYPERIFFWRVLKVDSHSMSCGVRAWQECSLKPWLRMYPLCSETRRVWPGLGWYVGGDVSGESGRDIGSVGAEVCVVSLRVML